MNRTVVATVLFLLSAVWVGGCDRTTSTTRPTPPEDKTDIHIRTPRTKVDVEGKGEGKGVNVNMEKKQ